MDTHRTPLRLVETSPWNKPTAYRPDPIDMLRANARQRPSWFAGFAADCRDVISEVRGSPYSHALVALLTIVGWTVLLVVPLVIAR